MIDSAISLITRQLNQYLRRTFDLTEDIVAVSNILEQDGTVPPHVDNKPVAFLVNIEKDQFPHRGPSNGKTVGADKNVVSYAPVYLNFYLMFAGNFSGNNYMESLKFISNTISFFQRRPFFDHDNAPDLDTRIDKLVLDIQNLTIADLGNLWGILSSRYLPSILYKVRLAAFDSDDVMIQVPTVTDSQPSVTR